MPENIVTKPPTLINILFTTRALTPGKLLAKPQAIRPMVLPIPITETRNIAVEASMLAFMARSARMADKKYIYLFFNKGSHAQKKYITEILWRQMIFSHAFSFFNYKYKKYYNK